MIAAFPMYDRPQTRAGYDGLWALVRDGLRARGLTAPDALDHATDYMAGWGRPDLVLGHICNLPYRARFRDSVTLIGASDYGLPGLAAGHYTSVWIVRADDPAQAPEDCAGYRFALSDPLSHSGWGAAVADAAGRGLTLRPHLTTGAHRASMAALAEGRADLATIDAVTWRMAERWEPVAQRLRVIGTTGASPGISFITRKGEDPAPYFDAITEAIAGLDAGARQATGLCGIVRLPLQDYDLPLPPNP